MNILFIIKVKILMHIKWSVMLIIDPKMGIIV